MFCEKYLWRFLLGGTYLFEVMDENIWKYLVILILRAYVFRMCVYECLYVYMNSRILYVIMFLG